MALIHTSNWETGISFGGSSTTDNWGGRQTDPAHADECISVVTGEIAPREGNAVMKAYIQRGWDLNGNARSEILQPKMVGNLGGDFINNKEYWIGFSTYMPDSADMRSIIASNFINAHLWQIHQVNGIATSGMNMRLGRYDFSYGIAGGGTRGEPIDNGTIVLGQWDDWIIHTNNSTSNDGYVRMWRNAASESESPVYEYTNKPIIWSTGSNLKLGIYREGTGNVLSAPTVTQYYDALKIGDSTSSFAEVKPGGDTPVIEDIITEVEGVILDGELGVRLDLSGNNLSATGKKVWLGQGDFLVEQVVTDEDATSVTFTVNYGGRLIGGPAKVYIGDPV